MIGSCICSLPLADIYYTFSSRERGSVTLEIDSFRLRAVSIAPCDLSSRRLSICIGKGKLTYARMVQSEAAKDRERSDKLAECPA